MMLLMSMTIQIFNKVNVQDIVLNNPLIEGLNFWYSLLSIKVNIFTIEPRSVSSLLFDVYSLLGEKPSRSNFSSLNIF